MMMAIVSDLTFIDDHPAAGEPLQPPLDEQPSIHSSASVRASRLGPSTAVGSRSQLTDRAWRDRHAGRHRRYGCRDRGRGRRHQAGHPYTIVAGVPARRLRN
jgi:hypothetical protein